MPPDSKETELGSSNQETSPSAGKNTGVVLVPCSYMKVHPYSYFRGCGYYYLSLENSADSYLCFQLALLESVSYFFFLYQSPSLLCTVFYFISSNIDEVLSINPSANVFVFGDFNVHHKDWLTYSGGTDRLGELCYHFSISNDITQIVNFPTQIPDCDSHSPALLDLFISSDTSICSTMAFPLIGKF